MTPAADFPAGITHPQYSCDENLEEKRKMRCANAPCVALDSLARKEKSRLVQAGRCAPNTLAT